MSDKQNLFSNFSPSNKDQWLDKINLDLKGKSLASLEWQLEENIRMTIAYSAEDQPANSDPIQAGRSSNSWQIGEYIEVKDMGEANAQALEGLAGGVNAPLFKLHHLPSREELDILLADIEPDFISVHFAPEHPGKDPAELFRNLIYCTRGRNLKLSQINGSMDFDPFLDWAEPPFSPLARILSFAASHTPHFRVLQVNGQEFHTGIDTTSQELALILAKGVEYLSQLKSNGIPVAQTNRHLQFSIAISDSYFVAIAKIRALKILWANALSAYGLSKAPIPLIAAHLASESQTDEREYNMIKAATQTMSAAIGGADMIFIPPADYPIKGESTSFSRRIARNVQHLLQMESHLDQVIDPAAGSYFIEQLTRQFCDNAWAQFQRIEKKGGYLQLVDLN